MLFIKAIFRTNGEGFSNNVAQNEDKIIKQWKKELDDEQSWAQRTRALTEIFKVLSFLQQCSRPDKPYKFSWTHGVAKAHIPSNP